VKLTFITPRESAIHDRSRRRMQRRRKYLTDLRHEITRVILAKEVRVGELTQDPDKLSKTIEKLDARIESHWRSGIGKVYVRDRGEVVDIFPFAEQWHDITVHKPSKSLRGYIEPGYVSWPSFDCRDVNAAEAWGLALVYAAKMARDLNRRAGL
jgi:hypothetical protein